MTDDTTGAPLDLPDDLFVCIDHVGVAVPDLDEAIAMYRDAFGMHVTHQETNEDQGVREAMVAVGDSGSASSCSLRSTTLDDREVPRPQGPGPPAARLPGHRRGEGVAVLRDRGLRLVRRAAPRHRRQPDQLRSPQGHRRRARRAGRARDALSGGEHEQADRERQRHGTGEPLVDGGVGHARSRSRNQPPAIGTVVSHIRPPYQARTAAIRSRPATGRAGRERSATIGRTTREPAARAARPTSR